MNTVRFDFGREEMKVASKIAARSVSLGIHKNMIDASMDIEATHSNGCALDLDRLLAADDFNFAHDVAGIARHLDRKTGKLGDCFLPRFAARAALAKAEG